MESLQCTVENKRYPKEKIEKKDKPNRTQIQDNITFRVISCRVKGISELVTVVGNMPDMKVGDTIKVEGDWKMNPKYGKQFSVQKWEDVLPSDSLSIEKYLSSGLIAGVGPIFAKKIVDKFGEETLNILDNDPNRLMEVEGIGQKKIEKIRKSWEAQREVKNIMLFLQKYDISTSLAAKIYKEYGTAAISNIKENPYKLAEDIQGIGFQTADQIAMNMGIEKNAFIRLRSGLLYALRQLGKDGHCFAFRDQLIKTAVRLLGVDYAELEITLDDLMRSGDVIRDKDAIYLPMYYFAESGCAKRLVKLLSSKRETELDINSVMETIEDESDIDYDEVQLQAIKQAISSKVMVLTGGPGTGKTTTTMGIISAYKMTDCSILLAAPTGRAAKRMSEATGMEARTIHRLIEFQKDGNCARDEDRPLEGDVLILDECSMIDVLLMYKLLKAVPDTMTVILVGDVDQLPSVGAGNVLRDIINSAVVPVVRLTRIFRQAQGSKIIMGAHQINHGVMPDLRPQEGSDFFFAPQATDEDIVNLLIRYCTQSLPNYYKADPVQDIQVLTPMKKGLCGTLNLNQLLQGRLNPSKICLKHGGTEYRLHDKVMQIKNNYDKDVFNGDIGIISSVNAEDSELEVTYDEKVVKYDILELDELMLAYATTIHKAQGSEFPIVVMPFSMSQYIMLQRNLLYTGVTRAKKILVLIGDFNAVAYAIRNEKTTARNTRLIERLKENM